MPTRLAALAAISTLALVAAAPAVASAPFWTQAPNLDQQGNELVAGNGGWQSYSGPVTKNVFRFVRDGVAVQGPAEPLPQSTPPDSAMPAGTYPDDPNANIYRLTASDSGHCFVVEVWGGIRSTYYTQDGKLAYDAWEWGHLDSFGNPAVTAPVCVGGTPPPPPPPPPPPAPPPPPVPQLAFVDTSLPTGTVGVAYTHQLSVQNATSASFSVSPGILPNGLTLSSGGMLIGTPTVAGQFTFTVKATDPVAKPAEQTLSLQVVAPDLVIAPQLLRGARANVPYSQPLSVVGGYAPYSYSIVDGALPKGMALSSDGILSGTPDAPAGQYTFQVRATDAYGLTTSLQLVFTVLPPRMAFETLTLPDGFRFLSYRVQLAVSGGGEPYTFTIVGGALPAGLVLGKEGTVSGRAQHAGRFGFTVQVTDANGVTRKHFYSLRVRQLR